MRILITSATSGYAHKLKLRLNSCDVILGDYKDLPTFMLNGNGLIKLPNPKSVSYPHEMLAFCLDNGIRAIYVLTDEEYRLLAEAVQLFKEYNIDVINGQVEI